MADPTATYPIPPPSVDLGVGSRDPFLGPAQQRTVRACLWVLGVLGSASLLGIAFSFYLVNHAPLLLIAMSPLGRHLVLVAPAVPPAAFLAVLVARRLAFYTACFHLGAALGPLGLPWLEARAARFAGFVRWLERIFARAPRLVVFALPGPSVSALAGIAGIPAGSFTALSVGGLLLRGALVLGFAEWLRLYIEIVRSWIDAHWVPGTILMIAGVLVHQAWRRRARPSHRNDSH